jgi:branched-chain amino acid transport system substrate-binding protein
MRRRVPLLLVVLAACACACERKAQAPASAPVGGAPAEAKVAEAHPDEGDTILLGQVASLTGSEATFGISARNGIALGVKEVNAAGGVMGKKVAVRVYDSQGRPEEAANAAIRLITQDKVRVILGEAASSNSMAMALKAQAAGVPMISPTSTNPAVTAMGDYIFRVCFIDPFQGYVMAKLARDHLKLSKVAILMDNKSAYSLGLTDVFTKKFAELGGQVVSTESYAKGDTDFRSQLTVTKQTRPEALFVPGYYTDAGIIARQARELGLKVPLLGADGWESPRLFELAGDALEGSYFSSHYSGNNPAPVVQRFIAAFRAEYGQPPSSEATLGYDAFMLAVDAMKRAKDSSGPSLRDAIAQTKDFPGVGGKITFDAQRNPVKEAVILKVQGKAFEFVTTVPPP